MSHKSAYIIDANVILRFFLDDHKGHSAAARELLRQAKLGDVLLEVPLMTILEVVFTLGRAYKQPQKQIADEMCKLLNSPGIKLLAPSWVVEALELFGNSKVSFGDACIAAEARHEGLAVATFDTDFDSLPHVVRFNPCILLGVDDV